MLIEVTGISSAGKSTALSALGPTVVVDGRVVPLVGGAERLLRLVGIRGRGGRWRRVVGIALAPLGYLVGGRSAAQALAGLVFAHRRSCLPPGSFVRWNGTFNAWQQLGWLLLLQRVVRAKEIVLLDTGPMHTVYNFFVDIDLEPSVEDVGRYIDRIPLADAVIWVTADRDSILQRTQGRSHRRVRNLDPRAAERFHDHAHVCLVEAASSARVASRLVEVADVDGGLGLAAAIKRIAAGKSSVEDRSAGVAAPAHQEGVEDT